MIKINLITEANKKGASQEGKFSAFNFQDLFTLKRVSSEINTDDDMGESDGLIKILLKLVIMGAGIGGLYYHESTNIPVLQSELSSLQAQSAELVQYNQKLS